MHACHSLRKVFPATEISCLASPVTKNPGSEEPQLEQQTSECDSASTIQTLPQTARQKQDRRRVVLEERINSPLPPQKSSFIPQKAG
jgi:hypothetical protein